MTRRALLLGLDDYQDYGLFLEAAKQDVTALAVTLRHIGWPEGEVAVHRSSSGPALTTNQMRRRIREFLSAAASGDELLLYISGHGVDQDGKRLIVPVDYFRDDPNRASDLVSDSWLYEQARSSLAGAILVIIDACREGIALEVVADPAAKSISVVATPPQTDAPTIAILYSCGANQKSWTGHPSGTSYFTAALCEILETDENASTVGSVLNALILHLPSILPEGWRQHPFLDERYTISGRFGVPLDLVIKEDSAARLRQQISLSPWCRLLNCSSLWNCVETHSEGLAIQIQTLAVRTEALIARAVEAVPQDRWRQESSLARFLSALDLLIPPHIREAASLAVSIASILVYEALLAGLVVRLAETGPPLKPTDAGDNPTAAGLVARAWRQALIEDEDWARRRSHLSEKNPQAAIDLLAWQLWSFAHRAGELWTYAEGQPPGAKGWLNDHLDTFFAVAPLTEIAKEPRIAELLNGRRLVRLARLLFAEPEDIEGEAGRSRGGLHEDVRIGEGSNLWHLNEVHQAHVLALAAGLTIDPRRLPDLIAEHLGLDPEFTLDRVVQEIERARWQAHDDTLILALDAFHPALHATLSLVVSNLERHRHRLELARTLDAPLQNSLPAAFLDSSLEPAIDPYGRPLFDPQHVRFTLDQKRIFGLLMGQALYGKPELALRELYQNALDACRYRRARDAFLATHERDKSAFRGQITIEAGVDAGRPWISCDDNGIGMGERHLREIFARAGRRFTDSHEYHLDKAQWQAAEILFWPNSRFGIGVLSYFMLAEEISLETRRLETDGNLAEEGLLVRITGNGSLFRVTRERSLRRSEAGTRVKLYLKDPKINPDILLGSIFDWLWLPEMDTIVRTVSPGKVHASVRFVAGELTNRAIEKLGPTIAIPTTKNSIGHPRAFWLAKYHESPGHSEGSVLVDGIVTAVERSPSGILVNLSEEMSGELSVDRTRVTLPGQLLEWLQNRCVEDQAKGLLGWNRLTGKVLANSADLQPYIFCRVDRDLRSGDVYGGGDIKLDSDLPGFPAHLGISIADHDVSDLMHGEYPSRFDVDDDHLMAARVLELQSVGYPLPPELGLWLDFARDRCHVNSLPLSAQLLIRKLPSDRSSSHPATVLGRLLAFQTECGHSNLEIVELAKSLCALGLLDANDVSRFEEFNGLAPATRKLFLRLGYRDEAIDLGHLCRASATLNLSPREIAELVRPLKNLGLIVADLEGFSNLGKLGLVIESMGYRREFLNELDIFYLFATQPADQAEILKELRSLKDCGLVTLTWEQIQGFDIDPRVGDLVRDCSYRRTRISLLQLIRFAQQHEISAPEIVKIAEPLAALGLIDGDLEALSRLEQMSAESARLIAFHVEEFAKNPKIGWPTVLVHASRTSYLPRDIAEWLSPLEPLGLLDLSLTELSKFGRIENLIQRILSHDFDDESAYVTDVDMSRLCRSQIIFHLSPEQIMPIAELFANCGLLISHAAPEAFLRPHPLTERLLSVDLMGGKRHRTKLSPLELAMAALIMRVNIRDFDGPLRDLSACGVDVREAQEFVASLDSQPKRGDGELLR